MRRTRYLNFSLDKILKVTPHPSRGNLTRMGGNLTHTGQVTRRLRFIVLRGWNTAKNLHCRKSACDPRHHFAHCIWNKGEVIAHLIRHLVKSEGVQFQPLTVELDHMAVL